MELSILFMVFLAYVTPQQVSPVFDSVESCCSLGKDWAQTENACDDFKVPVPGVIPEVQAPCITTMELCCNQVRRDVECQDGRSAALSALECTAGGPGGVHKDCCLACTLGITVATMAGKCDGLAEVFGCVQQEPFTSCCEEFLQPPSLDNTTQPSPVETTPDLTQDELDGMKELESSKCPEGFQYNRALNVCDDINECVTDLHDCPDAGQCSNTIGSWSCDEGSGQEECPEGFRFFLISCIDIDECFEMEDACGEGETCLNTEGSFICNLAEDVETEAPCPAGFHDSRVGGVCQDINECQTGNHDCSAGQRCSNTPGSFTCVRYATCGTGYTLNFDSGECEDNDECALGQHNCGNLGSGYLCRNIQGSFRCERKQCNVGEILDDNGYCTRLACGAGFQPGPNGHCMDIDECLDQFTCEPGEKCVNRMGSFDCHSTCGIGLRLDSRNGRCVDVDECSTGLASCFPGSSCVNTIGSFRCACLSGYREVSGRCQDIDECKNRMVCGTDSECQNSPGSFRCVCKQGFRNSGRKCVDVNECTEIPNICAQQCTNLWGSHRCHCSPGYRLEPDRRSCTDIDECKEEGRCVGTCVNSPGSFQCSCPSGYRLSENGRICQDVDECEEDNPCQKSENCHNTRGGHKCTDTTCPQGYAREPGQSSRCKRISRRCRSTDFACLRKPVSISFNFMSLVSSMRVLGTGVDLFTMQSARYEQVSTKFTLRLLNVNAPPGVRKCTKDAFRLKTGLHQATLALSEALQGPQDIELELVMEMYYQARFTGSATARIYIFVTAYQF